jgi:cytochrome d ubiquinol oxidase subunit I
VIEAKFQPMKIAAAEAQWETCQPCSFSLFQIGGGNNDQTPSQIIQMPHLLSLLATNNWNGKVVGLNQLQAQYEQQYGPGYYVPSVFIQYWSIRVMAYLAGVVFFIAAWAAWLLWRGRFARSRRFLRVAVWSAALPFIINSAGWLLTESGRQPWIVQGLQLTRNGVSPSVSVTSVAISLSVFAALYVILGVVDLLLMVRFARVELAPDQEPGSDAESHEFEFTY